MPLGGAQKERGPAASPAATAIRAFLRPEVPEPVAPPPVKPLARPESPPQIPPPPSLKEAKSEIQPVPDRAPAKPKAAPAIFFDPSQLTERPKPLTRPPLELLHSVLARGGTAELLLSIDETGSVTGVDIDSATLPPAVAERAAQIFATVRFSPGRIDGNAVKSRVRITVGAEERPK